MNVPEECHFGNLPDELISDIFLLCVLPSTPVLFQDPLQHDLLRVCRRWRIIAISTPRLWSTFQFDLIAEPDLSQHLPREVSTWIERSHALPLSIDVKMDEEMDIERSGWDRTEEDEEMERVVRILCEEGVSNRWKDIRLEIPRREECVRAVLDAARNAGREGCERFEVSFVDRHSPANRTRTMVALPDIPVLRIGGIATVVIQDWKEKMERIRTLRLDWLDDVDSCVGIIESAPNLRNLKLTFCCGARSASAVAGRGRGEPVVASNLIWIDFTFTARGDEVEEDQDSPPQHNIFQLITAPRLTTLCLTERRVPFTHLLSIKPFLLRSASGSTLERFYYCGTKYWLSADLPRSRFELISDILVASPSIKEVDVRCAALPSAFSSLLTHLSPSPSPPASSSHRRYFLAPRLKKLTFELNDETFSGVDLGAAKQFAKKRGLESVRLLRSFTHRDQPPLPVDDWRLDDYSRELYDLGIELSTKDVRYNDCVCDWEME